MPKINDLIARSKQIAIQLGLSIEYDVLDNTPVICIRRRRPHNQIETLSVFHRSPGHYLNEIWSDVLEFLLIYKQKNID